MRHLLFGACAAVLIAAAGPAAEAAGPVGIVTAENFYGDVAAQIGGADVRVTSIMSNPDQDPHLFEVSPSVGRAVSRARIVVYSGVDYDPWMEKLLGAARSRERVSIVVGDLTGHRSGDNPHIWYDKATMPAFARALTDALVAADLPHSTAYQARLARFEASMKPVTDRIAEMRTRLAGTPVTATEPVFGYMLKAIGMTVRNQSFQLAVMNNTEPGAGDVAAFETDLRMRKVRLLVYNGQASDPAAERMERIARESGVPVVAVTETEPPGKTYQTWMLGTLDAVDKALSPHGS